MDASQFRHLLKLGLGRAILYAKGHDVEAFRNLILDACLHCYAYDPQIEGTRADYMLELVDFMPGKTFYHEQVLNALPGSGDDYDAVQRFRFAACLAFDGDDRAKQAMYQNYKPGPRMGEGIGIDFLQMDGTNGLLFAAEKMGELLMATREKVDLGWLLSVAGEKLGEQEAREALRKAGTENPRIEVYRLAVEASRKRLDESLSRSGEMINASYDQLKPKLPEMTFTWITSWGERASDADIERAAQGLAAAQNPKEQYAHLRIFAHRRFPLDIQLLLGLVDVEQERVGLAALKALSQITHPAVRELAFRLVKRRARWRGEAIDLLARNFIHGDHAIALGWFEAEEDLETRHTLGSDLIDLWERYPDEETEVPMLRTVYEQGPCSFCREKIVRRLIERGALTEELRSECSFDANDHIREVSNPPAKPEALKTVSRSKRLRGRCRGPAKPLWGDGTACRGAHYRSFNANPCRWIQKVRSTRLRTSGRAYRPLAWNVPHHGKVMCHVLRELSNFCCLPGRAGGSPIGLVKPSPATAPQG